MPVPSLLYSAYCDYQGLVWSEFAGYSLPLHFKTGINAEHLAVRQQAGIFDVSHMGEILVSGSDAAGFCELLLAAGLKKRKPGSCVYSPLCDSEGGIIDDLILYILDAEHYLLVVNAANRQSDLLWIQKQAAGYDGLVTVCDLSDGFCQLAVQGPQAVRLIQERLALDAVNSDQLTALKPFSFMRHPLKDTDAELEMLISRTGYTGEDGFELYIYQSGLLNKPERLAASPETRWPAAAAVCPAVTAWASRLWQDLVTAGALPCGLGARDALRLEAGLPLYGHELNRERSPLESGLQRFVDLEKESIGIGAFRQIAAEGPRCNLAGLLMIDTAYPRQGYRVLADGREIGQITSGIKSPILKSFIALAIIDSDQIQFDKEVSVSIHGKEKKARITALPFYRRRY